MIHISTHSFFSVSVLKTTSNMLVHQSTIFIKHKTIAYHCAGFSGGLKKLKKRSSLHGVPEKQKVVTWSTSSSIIVQTNKNSKVAISSFVDI